MEEKEYKALMKQEKEKQKEVQSSKEAAKKYLIELEFLTPKGNLKKRFRDMGLCMQSSVREFS